MDATSYGSVPYPCQARLLRPWNTELLVVFPIWLCGEECCRACSIRNFDVLDNSKDRNFGGRGNTQFEREQAKLVLRLQIAEILAVGFPVPLSTLPQIRYVFIFVYFNFPLSPLKAIF